MRDILNKLEALSESTGLANRKQGDIFRDDRGNEITFNNIKFFPEQGGKLESNDLDSAIKQISDGISSKIQWLNNRTSRSGGFALASFTGPEGEMFFGRYLEKIKPDLTGNYVPNQINGYTFAGKAAAKAQSGLMPQDLLLDRTDLSAESILMQLSDKLGKDNSLYRLAYNLVMGESLPMTLPAPDNFSFTGFRDYFCEILQPIALQKGQFTGNAGEAAEIFLGGSFENTLISFDDSKTAGLSDSIITNKEGKSVKISTKGGLGATASTRNLINSVNELRGTDNGRKLIEKYEDVIDTLIEIQKQGQAAAPLYLGVKYDIIDETDAKMIRDMKDNAPVNLDNINDLDLSSTLVKVATDRNTNNPEKVNLYYHLIAAIAHLAASKVNNETNFSEAAATILNNSALIQMYTSAKENENEWTLNQFETVYPGDTVVGVYLSASKTYYSTGIKGNFTFKIDKGQGVPKDDSNVTGPGRDKRVQSTQDFAKQASDIALGRTKNTGLDRETRATGNVGRKKR